MSKSCTGCCRKGGWSTVAIPFEQFLLTWRGKVVEHKQEINPSRIVSLGISLAGTEQVQKPGPFSLGLDWIGAERRSYGYVGSG